MFIMVDMMNPDSIAWEYDFDSSCVFYAKQKTNPHTRHMMYEEHFVNLGKSGRLAGPPGPGFTSALNISERDE